MSATLRLTPWNCSLKSDCDLSVMTTLATNLQALEWQRKNEEGVHCQCEQLALGKYGVSWVQSCGWRWRLKEGSPSPARSTSNREWDRSPNNRWWRGYHSTNCSNQPHPPRTTSDLIRATTVSDYRRLESSYDINSNNVLDMVAWASLHRRLSPSRIPLQRAEQIQQLRKQQDQPYKRL